MRLAAIFLGAVALTAGAQAPLNLNDLIAEAIDRNPEILAAQKRLEGARQRPAQARTLPDPMVSFGYNSNGNPLPGAGIGHDPTSNIGWTASQELPYPGKLRLRSDVAAKEALAEEQQYRAVQLSVLSRLKQAFHRLHHTYEIEDILNRSQQLLRSLLRITEARYSIGKAAQADVFRAQTQITLIEGRIAQLSRERRARESEINALVARPLNRPLGEPATMNTLALTHTLDEVLAHARDASPTLLRDERMIARADAALNLARKDYYPDVTLNGGYFLQGSMPSMYMFRADVKVPLRTGRIRAEVAEQSYAVTAARRSYEADGQSLRFRIKDEYLTAETALKLTALYKQTVLPQAKLTVESALASFETGGSDFLSVLTSQMAAIEYEMTYHEQMQDFHLALARLEELTGMSLEEGMHP